MLNEVDNVQINDLEGETVYQVTEDGVIHLLEYIMSVDGPEFYKDMESGGRLDMQILVLFVFGDGEGEYDYAKYRAFAEEHL